MTDKLSGNEKASLVALPEHHMYFNLGDEMCASGGSKVPADKIYRVHGEITTTCDGCSNRLVFNEKTGNWERPVPTVRL